MRIRNKTQMLFEAKFGSYKVYDEGILSLIDTNGWVMMKYVLVNFMQASIYVYALYIGDSILSTIHDPCQQKVRDNT